MTSTPPLGSLLGIAIVTLFVIGCAEKRAPPRQLRTSAQSSLFLANVARHGDLDRWVLAAGASPAAARVWAERSEIADLGARIRREGGDWGCELAEESYRMGSVGVFSAGDRESLAHEAALNGAKQSQIRAFYADILKMSMSELRAVATAVCPEAYFP